MEKWVQEEAQALLGDHMLVYGEANAYDCALVIHARWRGRIRSTGSCQYGVVASLRGDTENITVASLHLPSWVSEPAYEAAVEECVGLLQEHTSHFMAVGLDADCDLGTEDDIRAGVLRDNFARVGLALIHSEGWTLRGRRPNGEVRFRRVDAWFCTDRGAQAAVGSQLHVRSDHRPVLLCRPGKEGRLLTFHRSRRTIKGVSAAGNRERIRSTTTSSRIFRTRYT